MEENNNSYKYEKDDLYQILDRITTWIENCDTKTSIVIGCIGVISAILLSIDYITQIKKIIGYMIDNISFWTVVFLLITTGSVVVGIIGCYYLFRVLVPKVDTELYKEEGLQSDSLMFFSTISKNKSYKNYKAKLEKCNNINWRNDIISQIYLCSKICTQKFEHYKRGLYLTLIAFISFISMMVIGSIVT